MVVHTQHGKSRGCLTRADDNLIQSHTQLLGSSYLTDVYFVLHPVNPAQLLQGGYKGFGLKRPEIAASGYDLHVRYEELNSSQAKKSTQEKVAKLARVFIYIRIYFRGELGKQFWLPVPYQMYYA